MGSYERGRQRVQQLSHCVRTECVVFQIFSRLLTQCSRSVLTPGVTESVKLELYFTPRQNLSLVACGPNKISVCGIIHRGTVVLVLLLFDY
jgi:hypothetical protein